jgi:hypothetical protein
MWQGELGGEVSISHTAISRNYRAGCHGVKERGKVTMMLPFCGSADTVNGGREQKTISREGK